MRVESFYNVATLIDELDHADGCGRTSLYAQASILPFGDGAIHPVAYTETEHYKVTKMFLTRTEKMLADLLGA